MTVPGSSVFYLQCRFPMNSFCHATPWSTCFYTHWQLTVSPGTNVTQHMLSSSSSIASGFVVPSLSIPVIWYIIYVVQDKSMHCVVFYRSLFISAHFGLRTLSCRQLSRTVANYVLRNFTRYKLNSGPYRQAGIKATLTSPQPTTLTEKGINSFPNTPCVLGYKCSFR